MYVPQLDHEIIAHPAQNRPYSSCACGTHACCGPIMGLTRRQVSVPSRVKPITNSLRNNAQSCLTRQSSQLLPSPSSVGRPPWCGRFVNSATRAQKASTPSAFGHALRMALETTPVRPNPVRSRVVAQLERWGCPILHSRVHEFPEKP